MKCVCGYEYVRKTMSMVLNKEDAIIGDKPFISLGQTLGHNEEDMTSNLHPLVACPKCGTLKLNL